LNARTESLPTDRVSRLAIGSGRQTESMRPRSTSLGRFYLVW